MLKRLVLFDIDGTLLWTGGAGRVALRETLVHVYGKAGRIDDYDLGGRTIKEIVRDLLAGEGLEPPEIWARFGAFTVAWPGIMRRVIVGYDVQPCQGAPELVAALAVRRDVLLGVLTANIEATARIKLEAAGYDPSVFKLGAYGDASEVRADLVKAALERAKALTGVTFSPQQAVLIGDTALDVLTAHRAGARSIAVLTGGKSRAELEAARPDYLFDDLSDTEAVIAAILAG